MGNIKLMFGDCLERMQEIENKSIDMVLCDLPYGTTASKWDKIIDFTRLWEEYKRVIKPSAPILLFSSGSFTYKLINSNYDMYRYKWVWIKNNKCNFVNAKNRPMTQYEEICVFSFATTANGSKNKMFYNPQGLKEVDIKVNCGNSQFGTVAGKRPSHKGSVHRRFTNYPTDVLYFESDKERYHTNQKPIKLCEFLIKTYTNEGGLVLDNCMGSGTTGVACVNTSRRFIGIENNKEYYKMANGRIKKAYDNIRD